MKKIKLTEATLKRIVERVVLEQEKENANKELAILFQRKKKGENVDKEIKELLLNNPNLKPLHTMMTSKAKQEIKKT